MKSRPLRNTHALDDDAHDVAGGSQPVGAVLPPRARPPRLRRQSQPAANLQPAADSATPDSAASPTATPPPTHTATAAPTNTAPPSPTATSAPSATPTVAPTQKPSDTPTPAPHAIVTSETLNMRSGPDTQFEAVARLSRGDALTVVGQSDGCNWLKVLTAQGVLGWVARQSGGVELVKLNLPCEKIPALSVPTPTARPLPSHAAAAAAHAAGCHSPRPPPRRRPPLSASRRRLAIADRRAAICFRTSWAPS